MRANESIPGAQYAGYGDDCTQHRLPSRPRPTPKSAPAPSTRAHEARTSKLDAHLDGIKSRLATAGRLCAGGRHPRRLAGVRAAQGAPSSPRDSRGAARGARALSRCETPSVSRARRADVTPCPHPSCHAPRSACQLCAASAARARRPVRHRWHRDPRAVSTRPRTAKTRRVAAGDVRGADGRRDSHLRRALLRLGSCDGQGSRLGT